MINAFEGLLRQELGNSKYVDYLRKYQKMEQLRRTKGEMIKISDVSEEIYEGLKEKDINVLLQMQSRLKDTIMLVLRLSKHYIFIVITYFLALAIIFSLGEVTYINTITSVILTIAFFYKTYEFLVNKYSYLDAYIVIAYKTALEKRLQELKS
ncbi:putative uncharacterized protein [Clostridium sp. CAG:411]|nr:hypothetical protein [Lachnospiraceae bacterium]CDE46313.1 putative uncharacterized protein [Clostridium sp. CAG:411]